MTAARQSLPLAPARRLRGFWAAVRHGRPLNPLALALVRTVRNPMGAFGLVVVVALAAVAIGAPFFAPFDPTQQFRGLELRPPAPPFLLGTDELGRDLLSRVIYGSRVSLLVGVFAVGLGASIGIASGMVAGYFGGWMDTVIMRLWDALLAFPPILLGIAVVTILGKGTLHVGVAIGVGSMPGFSRLTRACVLREREREYVEAARALGCPEGRILLRYIFPNCLGPLLVQISLAMGFAVLAEAGLAFLGLGAQPPNPSWGGMLNTSRAFLRQAPWYGAFPGIALAALLIGLNYLSDALREALDPRRINVS